MRHKILLFSLLIIFVSCQKDKTVAVCQLTKFITEYPATNLIHHDLITLSQKRIVGVYSYDLRNKVDTANRSKIFYEYNSLGKISAFRDETNLTKISRFDITYDTNGLAVKSTQTTNNVVNDEILFEYDAQKRPISAVGLRLLGVNRRIEYDTFGNPFRIIRADYGNLPVIYENTFDDKRNFFAGISEIGLYWLIRPLYAYSPFGGNNVIGTKFFNQQNLEFKEVPENRAKRVITYNENGFPETMSIILENQNNTISSISKFEYNCGN